MSLETLPLEIKEEIFEYLSVREIKNCRLVCRRWKFMLDSFSDAFWKKHCEEMFPDDFEDAHRKSGLSWHDLFKSMSLWSKVSDANVSVTHITALPVIVFHTLKNCTVSCPQKYNDSCPEDFFDTIVYFDLNTLEETHREAFDFNFNNCCENDELIVLEPEIQEVVENKIRYFSGHEYMNVVRSIRVIIKESQKHIVFGANEKIIWWQLIGKKVFIQRENYEFGCIDLTRSSGAIEVQSLVTVPTEIVEIALQDEWSEISIFTGNGMYTLFVNTLELRLMKTFFKDDDTRFSMNYFTFFNAYGFKWSSHNIFFRFIITQCVGYGEIDFTKYTCFVAHYFGRVIITAANSKRSIKIYYKPLHDPQDGIQSRPILNICMKDYEVEEKRYILHIDVVETLNGHKIIVLYCSKIYVIDLSHDDNETRKRSASLNCVSSETESKRKFALE